MTNALNVNKAVLHTNKSPTPEEVKKEEEKKVEEPVKSTVSPSVSYDFHAMRLTQIVLASGALFKPKDGIYSPQTEEQYDLLCYYEKLDMGYVERVKL